MYLSSDVRELPQAVGQRCRCTEPRTVVLSEGVAWAGAALPRTARLRFSESPTLYGDLHNTKTDEFLKYVH